MTTCVAELAGALDYRGPVYDADKLRFYQDIDLFVFATTYANEAQPTVGARVFWGDGSLDESRSRE